MKFPVYRFSDVLRVLRNESDLTVLQAAELTSYGNYERWESGKTRVRPEYLETLAEVFGIEGDLWLLTYAWLVDRYTPQPGGGRNEFTPQRLSGILRSLPRTPVDLGEHSSLAVGPMSHGQLALMCLVARYGASYAGADVPLVLEPTRRAPAPQLDGVSYILVLYTDVLADLSRFVARTFLLAGMGQVPAEVVTAAMRHILLLLTEPEPFASLLACLDAAGGGTRRGLDGFTAVAARSVPKIRRLAMRELEDLCRLSSATEGRTLTVEEVKAEIREVVRDDEFWEEMATMDADELVATLKEMVEDQRWWLSTEDWPVERVVPQVPDPDPALLKELQRLHDQLDRRCRRAIQEDVADAIATADPRTVLDTSVALRRNA